MTVPVCIPLHRPGAYELFRIISTQLVAYHDRGEGYQVLKPLLFQQAVVGCSHQRPKC